MWVVAEQKFEEPYYLLASSLPLCAILHPLATSSSLSTRFPNLGTIDILGQTILCCGELSSRIFASISGFYPLDVLQI